MVTPAAEPTLHVAHEFTQATLGCTFSPVVHSGSTYTFTATCKVMGTMSTSKTTIVTEGDSAFTLTVDGTTDGKPTREVMKAWRVGDCER